MDIYQVWLSSLQELVKLFAEIFSPPIGQILTPDRTGEAQLQELIFSAGHQSFLLKG